MARLRSKVIYARVAAAQALGQLGDALSLGSVAVEPLMAVLKTEISESS